jgi:hypothetical protein
MMENDRFDNFIGRAAREIDPAPAVPRDEMWQAISAARQSQRADETATDAAVIALDSRRAHTNPTPPGPTTARPITARGTQRAWLRWGAPLAAMLVIAFGLGRLTTAGRHDAGTAGIEPGPSAVASNTASPNATPNANPNTASAPGTSTSDSRPAATTDDRALQTLNREPATAVATTGPRLARSTKRQPAGAIVRGSSGNSDTRASSGTASIAYRMAAVKHFERVQTLLVSIPADARDGRINEIAVRAADLLVNTRLLLDSPAAADRDARRLLGDLELILAQVATISPTKSAEDVDMIQDAITKRDVLLRLHAVTAGQHLSGT